MERSLGEAAEIVTLWASSIIMIDLSSIISSTWSTLKCSDNLFRTNDELYA